MSTPGVEAGRNRTCDTEERIRTTQLPWDCTQGLHCLRDCTGGSQPLKLLPSVHPLWFFRHSNTGENRLSPPFPPDADLPECRLLCRELIRSFWKGQFTVSLCALRTEATRVQMTLFGFLVDRRGWFLSHTTGVTWGAYSITLPLRPPPQSLRSPMLPWNHPLKMHPSGFWCRYSKPAKKDFPPIPYSKCEAWEVVRNSEGFEC